MAADVGPASAAAPASIVAEGVCASRQGRTVLHGVGLRIARGWTAIVGPNGAGKSTLLRVLAGLQPVDRGSVRLDGRLLADWPRRKRAGHVAWLAQSGGSDAGPTAGGQLTVVDVVGLGRLPQLGLFGTPSARDREAVRRAMQAAGCIAWQTRLLAALSGGERQRVLLARTLTTEAPLLLLDEPTTRLDPPQQVAVAGLLQRLAGEQGVGIASVLHHLPLALQADRLVVLQHGAVVADGAAGDPATQAALVEVFGGAVRIDRSGRRWTAVPDL